MVTPSETDVRRARRVDMDKKLFAKLIDSLKEMNEVAAGKRKPSRTFQMDADSVKVPRAKSGSANPNVANRLARQRRS